MSDREELQALRRLAELEDKAAGRVSALSGQSSSKAESGPSIGDAIKEKAAQFGAGFATGGPVGAVTAMLGEDGQRQAGEGALTGAATIGNTVLSGIRKVPGSPLWLLDKAAPKQTTVKTLVTGKQSRPDNVAGDVASYLDSVPAAIKASDEANKDSLLYKGSKLGTQVAMTAPVGGAIAEGASAIPVLARNVPNLINAIRSGGMVAGQPAPGVLPAATNMLTRMAGGAITGGASAGLIDPEQAGMGAFVGGLTPAAVMSAGAAGRAVRNSLAVSPEVAGLAKRAEELGIKVPVDRIANSKPVNALASSLSYVPFSGRAATEQRMADQLNTALSRTFGQESSNVTGALRKASGELGSKFDAVLKNNSVKVDQQFLSDLAEASNKAAKELGADGAGIISKQVDDIVSKAASGEIDGQAAYNIKRTLDRIGNRSTPEAFYARELKKSLMSALDRSLGPEQSAAFALTRKQYGNMLDLENLAQNGAEGGVSIGRLANMKNIGNQDLQELADISAQFLRSRESPHGAMQRLVIGGVGAGAGGVGAAPYLAGTVAAGRVANSALNSDMLRNALLSRAAAPEGSFSAAAGQNLLEQNPNMLSQLLVRSAPVALTSVRQR